MSATSISMRFDLIASPSSDMCTGNMFIAPAAASLRAVPTAPSPRTSIVSQCSGSNVLLYIVPRNSRNFPIAWRCSTNRSDKLSGSPVPDVQATRSPVRTMAPKSSWWGLISRMRGSGSSSADRVYQTMDGTYELVETSDNIVAAFVEFGFCFGQTHAGFSARGRNKADCHGLGGRRLIKHLQKPLHRPLQGLRGL